LAAAIFVMPALIQPAKPSAQVQPYARGREKSHSDCGPGVIIIKRGAFARGKHLECQTVW